MFSGNAELEKLLKACATVREVYWLLQVLVRNIEVRYILCKCVFIVQVKFLFQSKLKF